jgi:hypothetical protein
MCVVRDVVDPINDTRLAEFVVGSHARRWGARRRRRGTIGAAPRPSSVLRLLPLPLPSRPTKPRPRPRPTPKRHPCSHPSKVPLDPELAQEQAAAQEVAEDGTLPQVGASAVRPAACASQTCLSDPP